LSSWVDLHDEYVDLARRMADVLGCDTERVIKIALLGLAIDMEMEDPILRKEKVNA